jgi:two-component system sensor histidine kinase BaeS
MTVSLRTRLFLTVGAVLAVSIATTGLLSRRATLVEVREVVGRPILPPGVEEQASAVQARLQRDGADGLASALRDAERAAGRPFVVVDPGGRSIVASSSPRFDDAVLRHASAEEGAVTIDVRGPAGINTVVVKGAPAHPLRGRGGEAIGTLIPLPPHEEPGGGTVLDQRVAVPAWIVATGGVAAIGLILTFALSRRILRPVGELTSAVRRMEAGDLDVRVARAADGRDEIGELARSFNALASRLADHDRARRQMVGDVAHELRSPVTNLRCVLESIQDGLATADRAAIDALHDETMYLQHVIADLQDLSLAEAGRLELHIEAVDVDAAARRAVAMTAASGAVTIDVPAGVPRVRADPARVEQILRNLLSNAHRHTREDGAIIVRARARAGAVEIEVADSGAGIEPAHLPHVFERFYRVDRARSRAEGGAGLGLAIGRWIAEAHGGSLHAESVERRGSTFYVELPAA